MTLDLSVPVFGELGTFNDYLCYSSVRIGEMSREIYRNMLEAEEPNLSAFDEADLRIAAAEIGAVYHENKHLIDMFGTSAGLSVVFGFFDCLERFVRVSAEMHRDGQSWRIPLSGRTRDKEGKTSGNELLAIRGFLLTRRMFDEPFHARSVDPDLNGLVPLSEIGLADNRLSSYAVARSGYIKSPDGTQTSFALAYPLGFEAFLEGAARTTEMVFLASLGFSKQILDAIERPRLLGSTPDRGERPAAEEALQFATPYQTTSWALDLLLQQREFSFSNLCPEAFIKIHDRVLMENELTYQYIGTLGVLTTVPDLAKSLADIVTDLSDDQLCQGSVPQSDSGRKNAEVWADRLESLVQADANLVGDNLTLLSVLSWRRYLALRRALPLLAVRLDAGAPEESGGKDYFLSVCKAFLPDVDAHAEEGAFIGKFQEPMNVYFIMTVFLIEIVRQIFENPGDIRCPKASGVLPSGLDEQNFAQDGHCDHWRVWGCGRFSPGKTAICAPKCLFEKVLAECALDRQRSALA